MTIDTVVFQLPNSLSVDHLKSEGFVLVTKEINVNETKRRLYMNTAIEGIPLSFTYYPQNPGYPTPMFLITLSPPNLLYGHNAIMLRSESEIHKAISKANKLLNTYFPWLSPINVAELVLQRLDLCYDHQVGHNVQDYLRILQGRTMHRRKTFPYVQRDFPERIKLEGVEYRTMSGQNKSMFYDKYLECRHESAKGILRQERKLYGPSYIAACLGIIEPPTLMHITLDRVAWLLESDLQKLGMKDTLIIDMKTAYKILIEKYGFTKAKLLIGYLTLRQIMTREQMIEDGAGVRAIQDNEKLIKDVSVCSTLSDENVTLPPLEIKY